MKKMKKLLCLATAVMTAASLSVAASAESNVGSGVQDGTSTEISAEDEGYILVSEEEYFDEDLQCNVIDRIYRKGNGIETYGTNKSGTDDIKREATFSSSGWEWVKIWVSGTFSWDSEAETATVKNCQGGYTILNNLCEIKGTPKIEHGDNAGGFWVDKYAYVKQRVDMKRIEGAFGNDQSFTFELDVNINGDISTNR